MAPVRDEDELTPICCMRCGARFTFGAGRSATECPVCRGRTTNPSHWRVTQERAMTAHGLETLVADLAERLKRHGAPDGKGAAASSEIAALLDQAIGFRRMFEAWKRSPPDQADRSKGIAAVAEWHTRAWTTLDQKPKQRF